MTYAKNAHPEWGYLAPAPSLMRATRIALIATAVGATVGCVVVLSLVDARRARRRSGPHIGATHANGGGAGERA